MSNVSQYVGKTYKEVCQLHPNVRVVAVGSVCFAVTADLRSDRLNVRLDETGVKVSTIVESYDSEIYAYNKVDQSTLDNAIVLSASVG